MYIKIKGDNHNSVLINIDHIDFVFEEKNGCIIYFAGTNITTEAKFEDIEKALVYNESENENISIISDDVILLTKKEIAALNEYQKKLDAGGDALEKE